MQISGEIASLADSETPGSIEEAEEAKSFVIISLPHVY